MPTPMAFSCTIRGEWHEAETAAFGSRINRAFTFSRRGVQGIEIRVTCAEAAYRLDTMVHRGAKGEVSIIHRADREVVWLDHGSRQFSRAALERMPPRRTRGSLRAFGPPVVAEPDGEIRSRVRELPPEAAVVRTTFHDALTCKDWTHFLVCDRSRSTSSAALRCLLRVLIGAKDLVMYASSAK